MDRVARAKATLTTQPSIQRLPEPGRPGLSTSGKPVWYHGTSHAAAHALTQGTTTTVTPTFTDANTSMGGIYLTTDRALAEVYARQAAQANGEPGNGVLLTVETRETDLLPDEDWIVHASEDCDADDNGIPVDPRLAAILNDAYTHHNGGSLSDTYKTMYDTLNDRHKVTWRDSLTWGGNVRTPTVTPDHILALEPL